MSIIQAVTQAGGFDKLARHGVAALLSSAAGISYPFSSDQLLTRVPDAVVNLMAEPTAQTLADANDLGCPLSCPQPPLRGVRAPRSAVPAHSRSSA